jgi:hypothetical protein
MLARPVTSLFAIAAIGLICPVAFAQSYQNDVGYSRLQNELAAEQVAMPDGSGVIVFQIEAYNGGPDNYAPDASNSQFTGKTIVPINPTYAVSGHATTVGSLFYGNTASMSGGIGTIGVNDADDFIGGGTFGFLNSGTSFLPGYTNARVANHSYVGYNNVDNSTALDPVATLDTLKRFDYVIQHDDFVNVVAENNTGNPAEAFFADSFNAISVGLTNGSTPSGSTGTLNDPSGLYVGNRAAPDIVAPEGLTSFATPIVSSAAALLVQVAHNNPGLSAGSFTSPRTHLTLEYAETNDVIKAALMAGADRFTFNASTTDQITNYGASPTTNGLDTRYGAGQIDIYNSYHIIAAGQQAPGAIQTYGFDFNPASASSAVEDYTFSGHNALTATLAWNLHVDDSLTPTLAHYQLHLYQLSAEGSLSIAASVSTIDNTQNIFAVGLNPALTYELQVTRSDNLGNWDYGLAWNLDPVPEPVGAPLTVLGLMALLARRNSKCETRNSNQ